jgi:hypothetical protein
MNINSEGSNKSLKTRRQSKVGRSSQKKGALYERNIFSRLGGIHNPTSQGYDGLVDGYKVEYKVRLIGDGSCVPTRGEWLKAVSQGIPLVIVESVPTGDITVSMGIDIYLSLRGMRDPKEVFTFEGMGGITLKGTGGKYGRLIIRTGPNKPYRPIVKYIRKPTSPNPICTKAEWYRARAKGSEALIIDVVDSGSTVITITLDVFQAIREERDKYAA